MFLPSQSENTTLSRASDWGPGAKPTGNGDTDQRHASCELQLRRVASATTVSNARQPGKEGGAVSPYTQDTFLGIIARHSNGELMLKILRCDGMPSWSTFWENCIGPDASPELSTAYARAHESYAYHRSHDADEIADTQQLGVEETVSDGPKGVTKTRKTADILGHRTLQVKTRQWLAERIVSRLASKQALTNPDGSALNLQPVINMVVLPPPKEPA